MARKNDVTLIPREVLFGNPEKTGLKISPDGNRIAWLAPDEKKVLQVWVRDITEKKGRQITHDKKRGIRWYFWAHDKKTLLYMQDFDGDENWHLFGTDLVSGNVRDLTSFEGVRAEPVGVYWKFPDELLVNLNLRDRTLLDVYRLNLVTGGLVLDTKNPGEIMRWIWDDEYQVRAAVKAAPDGGTEILLRQSKADPWRTWLKAPLEDNLSPQGFFAGGKSMYLFSSLGCDRTRLVLRDIETNGEKIIAASETAEADHVIWHPTKGVIQAVCMRSDRTSWVVIDPDLQSDFEALSDFQSGDMYITSTTDQNDKWAIVHTSDTAPDRYSIWDRTSKKGEKLFSGRPDLKKYQLCPMQSVEIRSRDNLVLHSYITFPLVKTRQPAPMVLLVHGGPWGRDAWGYDREVQLLTNRGYTCLQVNYRGSAGYGKNFLNAGNRQWGLKIHDDLIDAVEWAIKNKHADSRKIAIMGGSFGGYATLCGLAFTPDVFACGVDIVGPSNIKTLIKTIPPYWKPVLAGFRKRIGDINDPTDDELLRKGSPLFSSRNIKKPLLIGQGANDPRVKEAESEQIVRAIEKNGGEVTYVLYSDEGHGFARPENNLDFFGRAEKFLASYLGGRYEKMRQDPYPGSSAVVRVVKAEMKRRSK